MAELFFKVLAKDMHSLGLLHATKIRYEMNCWAKPLEPSSDHPRRGGGLWVVRRLSEARRMKKYAESRGRKGVRIFICRIGRILYESSCRVKTNKVILLAEIISKNKRRP